MLSLKRYAIFFSACILLFSFNDTVFAACNRYSDADDCAGSSSFLDSIITLLFVIGVVLCLMYWGQNQEEKKNEKEEYWNNLDKMVEEILEEDKRNNSKNLQSNAQKSIVSDINYYVKVGQKTKTYQCPKCNQKIRSKIEIGKSFTVSCPVCNHEWDFNILSK